MTAPSNSNIVVSAENLHTIATVASRLFAGKPNRGFSKDETYLITLLEKEGYIKPREDGKFVGPHDADSGVRFQLWRRAGYPEPEVSDAY
jgi:hypothetical protein